MRNFYIVIAALLLLSVSAFAHAPSEMELSFDKESSQLTINIDHGVRDGNSHYIDKLTIKVGKKDILVHLISSQETNEGIMLTYRLPDLKAGTTLEVTASCNRIGKMTRNIVIE